MISYQHAKLYANVIFIEREKSSTLAILEQKYNSQKNAEKAKSEEQDQGTAMISR